MASRLSQKKFALNVKKVGLVALAAGGGWGVKSS